jgi:hypothetical protein
LDSTDLDLTPKKIALITRMKHSSVKVLVRRLVWKRRIQQVGYGRYSSVKNIVTLRGLGGGSIISGMREGILSFGFGVHNLAFLVRAPRFVPSEAVKFLGGLDMRIVFRELGDGSVAVYVKGVYDFRSLPLLAEVLSSKLGVDAADLVLLRQPEWNVDVGGFQVEFSKNCVSIRDLQGNLERWYNKSKGVLRREVKPIRMPESLPDLQALLFGGVGGFHAFMSSNKFLEKAQKILEALKFSNETTSRSGAALLELAAGFVKRLDLLDERLERLEKLLRKEGFP